MKIRILAILTSQKNSLYDMTEFTQINRKGVFVMLKYQALICQESWGGRRWLTAIFMMFFYAVHICAQWLGTGVHICARAHMCTVAVVPDVVYCLGKNEVFL